jgi:hypothetical protein
MKFATTTNIQIGDIWYDSWGYDQTNVGFYKVVNKTGHTVTLIELEKGYKAETWGSGKVVPGDKFKEKAVQFKKRVTAGYDGKPTFKSPWHGYCYPYEGEPVFTSDWA